MLLQPGARLGPYEILAPLGAGGMGEVYRARDTRLGRTVAIKTLAGAMSSSPEFKARFQREARIVSALSHPHICALFDVGQHDGLDYVVIEHLEGETLERRLRRGRLSIDQAVEIGLQVADALSAAHAAGVVHRDLKPSNVMLTSGGARLLDFGIAKHTTSSAAAEAAETATSTTPLTGQGTVLGTLQYMAPEQLRGEDVDARTDIFALGAVLYEMATGARAFNGDSRTALMAAILEHTPRSLGSVRPVPQALELAVSRCLAKAPADRWQSARDVMHVLERARAGDVAAPAAGASRGWLAAAAGAALIAAIAFGMAWYRPHAPAAPPITFTLAAPVRTGARMPLDPFTTISPDGRHVAFTQENPSGGGDLWIRSLDTLEVRALPGTDGAFVPFWSPDSVEVAFFTLTDRRLKAVRREGGAVRVLCSAHEPLGGTWAPNGTLVFSAISTATDSSAATPGSGLHRVTQSGGEAAPLTLSIDAAPDDAAVRRYGAGLGWPQFLPDGRHFLFLHRESKTIRAAALGSAESTPLLKADSHAIYAFPGYLLFVRDGALMAQPFDSERRQLSGEALRIVENVRFDNVLGGGVFSASSTGTLAYSAGPSLGPSQATWMARTGQALDSLSLDTISTSHRLSPEGRRLVQDRLSAGERGDLWVFDLARRTSVRLTSSAADEEDPIWSPDGSQIVYAANPRGVFDLYRVGSDGGAREEPLLTSQRDKWPEDWSADGRYIVFAQSSRESREDLWLLDLSRPTEPVVLVETPSGERDARFSPDGRLIAYRSDRTGRAEIYVQPVPARSAVLASVNGGFRPFWRQDGKELYFVSLDNRLMSAPIRFDPDNPSALRVDPAVPLFTLPDNCGGARCVEADLAPDGRFLLVTASTAAAAPMTVIVNWHSQLQ